MEPVEINAGEYYLRQLRADNRLDDRPSLVEAFADPVHRHFVRNWSIEDLDDAAAYIATRAREWTQDVRYSWAIAEPTTGDLLGEVGLKNLDWAEGSGEITIWVHPVARGRGVATTAVAAVIRFAFGGIGLRTLDYLHDPDNAASAAVAAACGFIRVPDPADNDAEWSTWRLIG